MKVYLRQDPAKNWLLWWGARPDTCRYPIPEKRVYASVALRTGGDISTRLAAYREKKRAVYAGHVVAFDGTYDPDTRTLTLDA